MPDIIIRAPECREAARMCFGEFRYGDGVSLALNQNAAMEDHTSKFLVFEELGAAMLWAAVRTKELSSEGVEVYGSPGVEENHREFLREFPDKRASVPFKNDRRNALDKMLEW